MAGGVGGYLNKKHPQHPHSQYGDNENDAPITQPELAQRQAATREIRLKAPGLGAGRRNQSISGPGVPFRDAVTGPPRAGSPLTMQQAGAQNGFATQVRNQINRQGQAYAQRDPLWADSTLGSDSLDTVRDNSYGHYNDGNDQELEDTQGQHVEGYDDQDVGLSDQRSDSDPEEEEVDQNNVVYNQNFSAYSRQPGTNQTNIPVRGVHTGRFVVEPQVQQHQQQVVDTFAPSEVDEDTMHSIADDGGRNHPRKGSAVNGGRDYHRNASSKRQAEHISNLDFDEETLHKMPYEELRNQSFDENPSQAKKPVTQSLTSPPQTLSERMGLFKAQSPEDRAAFLATLSIDEWEEAGQWLMVQFGTVMTKVAAARRERRKIAAAFEEKLAARDAEVREKTDGVTAVLQQMKNGGQDLLRGRTPT
ncbi:hypothetical protein V500_08130 [Pseudogymnoascus sp. VKM F-4518 (FW-2643)]|nr:hypothetical protein V500_08130 [Pseudogymnoascus sp. VKM F-4518 (FW-2643)]